MHELCKRRVCCELLLLRKHLISFDIASLFCTSFSRGNISLRVICIGITEFLGGGVVWAAVGRGQVWALRAAQRSSPYAAGVWLRRRWACLTRPCRPPRSYITRRPSSLHTTYTPTHQPYYHVQRNQHTHTSLKSRDHKATPVVQHTHST